ncbi:putative ribonuclease H-like domain-containing protein [Tanacetum coccineum]
MDLKWQLSLLSMRAKRYFQRTDKKIFINANDTARYDKSNVECSNCHKMGYFARECRAPRNKEGQFRNQDNTRKHENNEDTSSKAMLAIDGVGFDWSDMAEEQVQTNMALMMFSDYENDILFSEEVAVLKREVACKDYEINVLKSEFEKVKQEKKGIEFKIEKFDNASKSLNKLLENDSKENSDDSVVKDQVSEDTSSFVESPLNVDKETVFLADKKKEFVKSKNHKKPVKKSVSFDHIQAHCKYHQREMMVYGNNYKKANYNYTTNKTHPNAQRNMVPRAVLMKSGLKPFNIARKVNTAHPKSTVFSAKPMSHFSTIAQSIVRRPFQSKTVLSKKRFTHKVNTAKAQAVNTARPKAVKTARPNSAVVNAVRGKPLMDDKGFVNSGCSRHMTGNITYLLDFKEFIVVMLHLGEEHMVVEFLVYVGFLVYQMDVNSAFLYRTIEEEIYVTQPPRFKDPDNPDKVYKVVKELYRLHQAPRAWYETLANYLLGNGFKIGKIDQTLFIKKQKGEILLVQVYVDDIISGSTNKELCTGMVKNLENKYKFLMYPRFLQLFLNKDTRLNTSHKRLYIAPEQHKASCKSKVQNSITQPLFMLHMDLFGLTFVSSLMNKKYCLVVTEINIAIPLGFSFSLKDESSGSLKNFIADYLENLVDKKEK